MNGRKLYREYAKSKGREAREFIEIKMGWYQQDTLITKDNKGDLEELTIDYREVVHWIIQNVKKDWFDN